MKKLKRTLYLVHRWLGIIMCLFIGMWFFSGVVMMYMGFPSLTETERLNGLPTLNAKTIATSLSQFTESIPPNTPLNSLKLTSVLNRPAYLAFTETGQWLGMFADNGEALAPISPTQAKHATLLHFKNASHANNITAQDAELIEFDQWTVSSSLKKFRPLYNVSLSDDNQSQLYVSSITGTVVRDTTQTERIWNWLGANLHWIYPVALRQHASLWADIIIVISIAGLVVVITGTYIGILRLRLKRLYRGTSNTPYRGIMKLHHLVGLGFTFFLITYLFSGLMSMNPWGVFNDKAPFEPQYNRYQFGVKHYAQPNQDLAWFASNPNQFNHLKEIISRDKPKEVTWHWISGKSYVVTKNSENERNVFINNPHNKNAPAFELEHLISSSQGLLIPNAKITKRETLEQYDLYYYSHHERFRPLPALRIQFNDENKTWFHVDKHTGEIINRLTDTGRVKRWLYHGLHSLDFTVLIQNRPLWDIVVIVLSLIGFVFSITSIKIALARLKRI